MDVEMNLDSFGAEAFQKQDFIEQVRFCKVTGAEDLVQFQLVKPRLFRLDKIQSGGIRGHGQKVSSGDNEFAFEDIVIKRQIGLQKLVCKSKNI